VDDQFNPQNEGWKKLLLSEIKLTQKTQSFLKGLNLYTLGELAEFSENEVSDELSCDRETKEELGSLLYYFMDISQSNGFLRELIDCDVTSENSQPLVKNHLAIQGDLTASNFIVDSTDEWKNIRIEEVGFSVRASNSLRNYNIKTLGELAQLSSKDLLRLPNFGKKSLSEVELVLDSMRSAYQNSNSIDDSSDEWMYIPIEEVGFSIRIYHCLKNENIKTLGELAQLSSKYLLGIPNFGKKSLSEVQFFLNSIRSATKKRKSINYLALHEPLITKLNQAVGAFALTLRSRIVLEKSEIVLVGELIQLKDTEILELPHASISVVEELKTVLDHLGLSLGTNFTNWPYELPQAIRTFQLNSYPKVHTNLGDFNFIEDELCAAIEQSLKSREYQIVLRRTGWDGGEISTLEKLRNEFSISRERVRQIEQKGLDRIQSLNWQTPLLESVLKLVIQKLPVLSQSLSQLLIQNQLSQKGMSFKSFQLALKTFGRGLSFDSIQIGGEEFIVLENETDRIEATFHLLLDEANRHDFVFIQELDKTSKLNLTYDEIDTGIDRISKLSWVGCNREIYWNKHKVNQGRNKIINTCRKILTVSPTIPIEILLSGLRKVKEIPDDLSADVLEILIQAIDDFELHNDMVSRGPNFSSGQLSNEDKIMIKAAEIAGTIMELRDLRAAVVQQGKTPGVAQLMVSYTPWWTKPSRGQYRFILNENQLKEYNSIHCPKENIIKESLVELEVTHRHLFTGTHTIKENSIKPGSWPLEDECGNNLGQITVTTHKIKGLNQALEMAGIDVGTYLLIEFSIENQIAVLHT